MKIILFVFLFIKNIRNYGYINSIKIIFYELFFFKSFTEYKLIENDDTSYINSKLKKVYNTGFLPTPYYFLIIIKKYLKLNKLNNFNFIDLGCGFSRPAFFLNNFFKIKYFGFEINKNLLKKNNTRSFKFFCLNLRNTNKLIKILKKNIKSNQINIFFIADPFDIFLINEILNKLGKAKLINLGILANIDFNKLNKKNFKLDLVKKFNKRNLYIIKNKI